MNERMRILKLLEEGKITTEEAARLLEALKEEPRERYKGPSFWASGLAKNITDAVTSSLKASFGEAAPEMRQTFKGKKEIRVSSVSGNVNIKGWDENKVEVFSTRGWFRKVREENDSLSIKELSGDLSIKVPHKIILDLSLVSGDAKIEKCEGEIYLKAVSGDIEFSDIKGELTLKSVSGDVRGKGIEGRLESETHSGETRIDFEEVENVKIKTRTGDVELTIPRDSSLKIELKTEDGNIDCDLPLKGIKKEEGYLKGVLGKGKGELRVKIKEAGDVKIRER